MVLLLRLARPRGTGNTRAPRVWVATTTHLDASQLPKLEAADSACFKLVTSRRLSDTAPHSLLTEHAARRSQRLASTMAGIPQSSNRNMGSPHCCARATTSPTFLRTEVSAAMNVKTASFAFVIALRKGSPPLPDQDD